jgi:hypothetical protein
MGAPHASRTTVQAFQFLEERDQFFPLQFTPDHQLPRLVNSVKLEGGFGGIQTNHAKEPLNKGGLGWT